MSGTFAVFVTENITESNVSRNSDGYFGRHEYLKMNPWTAFPTIILITIASLVGTFGNVMTILAVKFYKKINNVERIFIVNLALSDLYVTTIADPMSIVAKLEGEDFFNGIPYLCQVIASLCTISCVTSLLTIVVMSITRFIFVCKNKYYKKIFSSRNCIIMCLALYCVGLSLVLLNQAGIGDHSFDRKSLECIWDRMATFPYTVAFSVTLVWFPSVTLGICYLRLYLCVRSYKKIIQQHQIKSNTAGNSQQQSPRDMQISLAKTLFLIYAVFVTFWAPYAVLMVTDVNNTFSHEVHVCITTFAHLHPSINWLIYLFTQRKFAEAYRYILSCACYRRTYFDVKKPAEIILQDQQNDLGQSLGKTRCTNQIAKISKSENVMLD